MAEVQIGVPVGGGKLVSPEMAEQNTNTESSISKEVFATTKDVATLRATLTNMNGLYNGYYSGPVLNTMTDNDMLHVIMGDQEGAAGANANVTAHAVDKAYIRGNKVTLGAGTLQALRSGTSGAVAPSLPVNVYDSVTDGDITWVRIA